MARYFVLLGKMACSQILLFKLRNLFEKLLTYIYTVNNIFSSTTKGKLSAIVNEYISLVIITATKQLESK